MLNLTSAKSAVSRTNQIRIEDTPEVVADRLFQYLFRHGKGIEMFRFEPISGHRDYTERDRQIRQQVKQRLAAYQGQQGTKEPQYCVEYDKASKQSYVLFLSPNKNHSAWKGLFVQKDRVTLRQRILNLIFKFHILSRGMSSDLISGFEYVTFPITRWLAKESETLYVWGLEVNLNFNPYRVVTMHLKRARRTFTTKNRLRTLDDEELGEVQVYEGRSYYYSHQPDARKKNNIYFMDFNKGDGDQYARFKQTRLYYYQLLMTELETFLKDCGIIFSALDFQCQGYLSNSYIHDEHLAQVKSLESLVIINNTGTDLQEEDQLFLSRFFRLHGVARVEFYKQGKTISRYAPVQMDDEAEACWQITEVFPWAEIKPEQRHNYLVFNRELDEDSGSMASRGADNYWYPASATELNDNSNMDFYSQFKRRFSYLAAGVFYSMQGINLKGFTAVSSDKETNDAPVLVYADGKVDPAELQRDCGLYTDGRYLSVEDNIVSYAVGQDDLPTWEKFCEKHKIKVSPEFQRVMVEISIKSWIREGLSNSDVGLPINDPTLPEYRFYVIYVRSPRDSDPSAVAVHFMHKDGQIYILDVTCDLREIEQKFPFLAKRIRKDEERLYNDQLYYADEDASSYISNYTKDYYTPTLIGRPGILQEMAAGTLRIDRTIRKDDSSRLLPIVTFYNSEVSPIKSVQDMICLDVEHPVFIQYYVPPKTGLKGTVKHGFRVYHLIGSRNSKPLTTQELLDHPLTAFHFNTLTQNILRASENSQASLLQKVARVLIEN